MEDVCGEGDAEFGGCAFPPRTMRLGKRWMMMERKEKGEKFCGGEADWRSSFWVAALGTDLLLYVSAVCLPGTNPTPLAPSDFWELGPLLCFHVSLGHHLDWGLVFPPFFCL